MNPLVLVSFILFWAGQNHAATTNRHRSPLVRYSKLFHPKSSGKEGRITIANMTCGFVEQPLNHFSLPRNNSFSYRQRFCTYNGYVETESAPVLFYTGNESPLEEYINNTGIMFELAEELKAQVLFVEHRYEGQSLPSPNIANCMAYSSSIQALADYAVFIETHLNKTCPSPFPHRPVIAFGGSYGGMLSAWFRMLYPHLVAGAIAGSAPIWGLPLTSTNKIDAAFSVIQHGLEQSYPPTLPLEPDKNFCSTNLLAAWPLMQVLGKSDVGRDVLTESFSLCYPLRAWEVQELISWAQSPWFDLAEGSFPYPSTYIPFALTHNVKAELPAWPLQAACWNASRLHADLGIRIEGNRSDVSYTVHYGDSLAIEVNWDLATVVDNVIAYDNPVLKELLTSVRDAVSIWFNITKDVLCFNLTMAPNMAEKDFKASIVDSRSLRIFGDHTDECWHRIKQTGSWPALCCNDEMNLIITEAQGLGNDIFWPPSHPRGTHTHADVISFANDTYAFCEDSEGIFGFAQHSPDLWSTWLDIVYGGKRIQSHSNIVFSNGLLDPWSAAGVYSIDPTHPGFSATTSLIPGLLVQNISDTMIALILEYGGHHTDLMYSNDSDPPSITEARRMERVHIQRWIDEWFDKHV